MKMCAHLIGKWVLLHTNHQNKPTYEHHQTFPVSDRVVRHARPVFFRTPPYGQLPEPMGGFDPLGLLPIHLFHGVSGLTDLCAHGHAREGLGQTDRRARHASSHVRRACIASKTRKNEKNRMGRDLNENVRTIACGMPNFANESWRHQQRKKGATDCHKG